MSELTKHKILLDKVIDNLMNQNLNLKQIKNVVEIDMQTFTDEYIMYLINSGKSHTEIEKITGYTAGNISLRITRYYENKKQVEL